MVFNNLENARSAKPMKRLCIRVLAASLRDVERIPDRIFHVFRKRRDVGSRVSEPKQRLDLGQSLLAFNLCLNKHN